MIVKLNLDSVLIGDIITVSESDIPFRWGYVIEAGSREEFYYARVVRPFIYINSEGENGEVGKDTFDITGSATRIVECIQ